MAYRYQDLVAWKKAMELAKETYEITKGFPKQELFGLVTQIRRAAISVPSNIAEGQGRLTKGEFRQFLGHARGSLFELQTQMRLADQLGYVQQCDTRIAEDLADETARLLNGLIASLK